MRLQQYLVSCRASSASLRAAPAAATAVAAGAQAWGREQQPWRCSLPKRFLSLACTPVRCLARQAAGCQPQLPPPWGHSPFLVAVGEQVQVRVPLVADHLHRIGMWQAHRQGASAGSRPRPGGRQQQAAAGTQDGSGGGWLRQAGCAHLAAGEAAHGNDHRAASACDAAAALAECWLLLLMMDRPASCWQLVLCCLCLLQLSVLPQTSACFPQAFSLLSFARQSPNPY